ncbi:hypothetical protein [Trichocoleus sp. AS-A1]|uniref:hypothetical protein n=1 Tax=Trichocoleus sp. AS-A1 TaxID=2933921 RepID=UPI0032986CA6
MEHPQGNLGRAIASMLLKIHDDFEKVGTMFKKLNSAQKEIFNEWCMAHKI